jgi:putative transposase
MVLEKYGRSLVDESFRVASRELDAFGTETNRILGRTAAQASEPTAILLPTATPDVEAELHAYAREILEPVQRIHTSLTRINELIEESQSGQVEDPENWLFAFRNHFAAIQYSHTRRIVHIGVTHTPTDNWIAQQLRAATPFGDAPKFLIRDNDAKYGSHFDAVATGSGIEVLRTPIRAPRANAICERFLGSVRRECLDHLLIVSEAHLRRVLIEYVSFFNRSRPHQDINQSVPEAAHASDRSVSAKGNVVAFPVLGGLHHQYRRVA